MLTLVEYTITGLATAGIYAILASGLTLTYMTTGVFNFAHGAVGMICAFFYWQLRYGWGFASAIGLGDLSARPRSGARPRTRMGCHASP